MELTKRVSIYSNITDKTNINNQGIFHVNIISRQ